MEGNNEGFFSSLVGLEAEDALDRCKTRVDELRRDIAQLQDKLAQTPRADKKGAHEINQEILRAQSKLRRMKPVITSYRSMVERRETHGLWVQGVRTVCGQDALRQVYEWMSAERKRRAQAEREARIAAEAGAAAEHAAAGKLQDVARFV